ncbi:endonuclease Q family protein [Virgibacillus pantothenticus]|uniref:endonuclease Q family protein n=1 Tax=Virgibacillus pantothenticus TaxID=1473 RepID=UPI000984E982|nr:endonuclease Q family protein [Virgibacillus pantothenticus]
MLSVYTADLHIHIGRDMYHKPVKITASNNLTLPAILKEASRNKGIDMIGIVDCQAPAVLQELKQLIYQGIATELEEGGVRFESVTLLLGSEIEVYDERCQGPVHVLCYFPGIHEMELFSDWLRKRMKNISLSSQRFYGTAIELQRKVKELQGVFIPAHIFTPFKSLYGKGVLQSLTEILASDLIDGVELGLSADTYMADQIKELHAFTYLTNSDAHSLRKIAREYQHLQMKHPSFKEFRYVLANKNGRHIKENYGMNPKLGKYYRTVCSQCLSQLKRDDSICPNCHSRKYVKGVADRIEALKDTDKGNVARPGYTYQVPLEYLPGLGKKTYEKLLKEFGTEMYIIHQASYEELANVVQNSMAQSIIDMRHGKLHVHEGGGGKYGSIK